MTVEIGILFAVLTVMAYFFFTEKLPIDLTAFLGLAVLILAGFVTPSEAFTGFSSPAVITMLSIFFVSTALLITGLADFVGERLNTLIGGREVPLIIVIMVGAGVLSAFMNNIAATAVLLPAVASAARTSGIAPSRLFMPLSFGAILGGATTLVGTPPNILAADLLREKGMEPFGLFDFTPLGLMLLGVGVVYMVLFRRQLLPDRGRSEVAAPTRELFQAYQLQDNLFSVQIPEGSSLDGETLRDTRCGQALGLQVLSVLRGGQRKLVADPDTVLLGGDALLVQGEAAELENLIRVRGVAISEAQPGHLTRGGHLVDAMSVRILEDTGFVGKTLRDLRFRERFGALVVGIRRGDGVMRSELASVPLEAGDELLVVGSQVQLENVAIQGSAEITQLGGAVLEDLEGHLFELHVTDQSGLVGSTVAETRMAELVGLTILGIVRGADALYGMEPTERVQAGDHLLVTGEPDRIRNLLSLGDVELQRDVSQEWLQSQDVTLVEATLAPRSRAAGQTLGDLDFRERYGLRVLAIWREGHPLHGGLARLRLRVGDALLLQGPWNRIQLLGSDPDFVVLSASAAEPRRTKKAPAALAGLLIMVGMVVTGFQPIHVAAFVGATFVVLAGAISMEEAYRGVEWRAVFLVAAILPVGMAMERTGAAALISQTVTDVAGPFGPHAVLAGLFCLSSLLSQCLDGAPAVVLLTPVALGTAEQLGLSPYPI
ncbi:MAG: SLC13 family permease, partial [Gemmatimonadetes bacterium]|nr:SLC13 family permease [Gemmatimonadota bacterium]